MGHQTLYNRNYNIFLGYLKNTNQKEVLINKIKSKIKNKIKKRKKDIFTFTDIGAGDGRVTLKIINFLKNKVNLKVNYIEPSKNLINIFKKNNPPNFVKYINRKFQDIELPSSDFILSSHSIYYSDNFQEFINSIIKSLNKSGIALIIKNNPKSEDIILKKNLIKKEKAKKIKPKIYFDIINYLKQNNIKFESELVKSRIKITNCFKLNNEGKSIISFFYKKPFNQISKEEIIQLQIYLRNNSKGGILRKLEDYIWIFK